MSSFIISSKPAIRYLGSMVAGAVLTIAAITLFTWYVDPYSYYGNGNTHPFYAEERYHKANYLKNNKPVGILLGNSKIAYIDPNLFSGSHLYNAAFAGATPEEMLRFIDRYVDKQTYVLVGLDYFMFNETFILYKSDPVFVEFRISTVTDNTFSVSALKRSFQTLYWDFIAGPVQEFVQHQLTAGGHIVSRGYGYFLTSFFKPKITNIRPNGQRNSFLADAKEDKMVEQEYSQGIALNKLAQSYYSDISFSERRMKDLLVLKELLEKRNIRYQFFLNPIHEGILARRSRYVSDQFYIDFINRLREIFPSIVDLNNGDWADKRNYYHFDAEHFKPSVAALFMPQIIDSFCYKYSQSNLNKLPCDNSLEEK